MAIVSKWCNGTYLECQDMFRENGIFRDVLLHKYEKTYIYDYEAIPVKKGNKYNLDIKIDVKGDLKNKKLDVALHDGAKFIATKTVEAEKEVKLTLENLDVLEWSAEIPNLYQLFITLYDGKNETMTIRSYTGFKDIKIKNRKAKER